VVSIDIYLVFGGLSESKWLTRSPWGCGAQLTGQLYRVVQKSGHLRNSMGVRFFGPPCICKMTY